MRGDVAELSVPDDLIHYTPGGLAQGTDGLAEEIAALNLAKYRKAQQQLEEAEERSQAAESNMVRMRAGTPGADRIAEIRNEHGRFMSPFFVSILNNI